MQEIELPGLALKGRGSRRKIHADAVGHDRPVVAAQMLLVQRLGLPERRKHDPVGLFEGVEREVLHLHVVPAELRLVDPPQRRHTAGGAHDEPRRRDGIAYKGIVAAHAHVRDEARTAFLVLGHQRFARPVDERHHVDLVPLGERPDQAEQDDLGALAQVVVAVNEEFHGRIGLRRVAIAPGGPRAVPVAGPESHPRPVARRAGGRGAGYARNLPRPDAPPGRAAGPSNRRH